ncbi:GNAT family N-acetyltransferase [Ruoffia tabacinasalis]|uniref:GNAT family N-acetyltransferase n=1 Tax=Ruoffia tabacinasalis TaxID=87458 RepID=UPI003F9A5C12
MAELIKCKVSDVEQLQSISIETFVDTFKDQNTEENLNEYLERAYSIEQLTSEINQVGTDFYFLKDSDLVVGYLKLNIDDAQSEKDNPLALEVERIYVLPQHKRKGYGKLLLEFAYLRAKELNRTGIWLGVWEHNYNALAFYKKMGYQRVGEHTFIMGDDAQVDYIMLKEL